jgi:succinyl-CoA synthetase alpha subunit
MPGNYRQAGKLLFLSGYSWVIQELAAVRLNSSL